MRCVQQMKEGVDSVISEGRVFGLGAEFKFAGIEGRFSGGWSISAVVIAVHVQIAMVEIEDIG